MEKNRIHLYTFVQIIFFGLLYMVKTIKTIAIAFPFFILLCIPVRLYLLPKWFYDFELIVLDGSPEEVGAFVRKWAIEADEYENQNDEVKPLVDEANLSDTATGDDKGDHGDEQLPDDEADLAEKIIDVDVDVDPSRKEGGDVFPGHDMRHDHLLMAAKRRSGRHQARKKTVSDLSGMLQAPTNQTAWSHVLH